MFRGLSLLAMSEVGGLVKRNMRALVYYAAAAAAALIGVVFILQAIHAWLLTRLSPMEANLVIAGAMLALGLVLYAVGRHSAKRKSSPPLSSAAMVAAPLAAGFVGRNVSYATLAVAAMVTAGVIFGRMISRD